MPRERDTMLCGILIYVFTWVTESKSWRQGQLNLAHRAHGTKNKQMRKTKNKNRVWNEMNENARILSAFENRLRAGFV